MSHVMVASEAVKAAGLDLAAIGSTLDATHLAVAAPITDLQPAAADEISEGIARLFSGHGQEYQAAASKAEAFRDQFVERLNAGADVYASAEAANAALLPLPPQVLNIWGTLNGLPLKLLYTAANVVNDPFGTLGQLFYDLVLNPFFLLPLNYLLAWAYFNNPPAFVLLMIPVLGISAFISLLLSLW
ncbi:hypothetical protein MBOU_46740 [Mycobacterium bourgelatii]|uniref:PE domain-containing protein n=2 Tax=Mycobacterium bourgelatii TaxID=1273442 RepID=A0A7I9YVL4_MYCBU|nr:hypothetical protein MBOU_46740 [Mycobacterium bourgelatii]